MATLPAATDFTGAAITEAQFKTAITDLRTFLADLLGTAGTVATALNALGALGNDYIAKSIAYTVIAGDRGKVIGCTGTFTLTLTAAATMGDGFCFAVKNIGTGVITIDPNSTENLDGATASLLLTAGESAILICDGTGWQTLSKLTAATASLNGYMTAIYAAKLDGIAAGANLGVALDIGVGGVGMMSEMYVNTGGPYAAGATVAGSSLRYVISGASSGVAATGTWRNITNQTVANPQMATFQRIA